MLARSVLHNTLHQQIDIASQNLSSTLAGQLLRMASLKYTNKLSGKRVLVFGGTSGVGFCVAEAALEYGAHVTISGSSPEKLSRAIDRLKGSYPENVDMIDGKTCDLAKLDDQQTSVESLLSFATQGGALDHISFSAGDVFKFLPISEVTPAYLHKTEFVRIIAPTTIAKLAPKYMRQSTSTSFTITSGIATDKPPAGWAVMASHGGAIEALVRGLAVDLKPVRVNGVQLGAVRTEIFDTISERMSMTTEQLEASLDKYAQQTLVGKLGRPEEVAEAYLYCMKDCFVTGSVIRTNGGILLV